METPNNSKSDLEVTGVSRSGRVRKKSSKLMDFQSPDDVDTKIKRTVTPKTSTSKTQSGNNSFSAMTSLTASTAAKDDNTSLDIDDELMLKLKADDEMNDQNTSSDLDQTDNLADSGGPMDDDSIDSDYEHELHINESPPTVIDPSPGKSIYMTEKSAKRKVMKDGKLVMSKAHRKDKGKSRYTAYMLWAKGIRQDMLLTHPELDFATISRRLGEMWANVPSNEKYNWKRRAKRLATTMTKPPTTPITTKVIASSKFLNRTPTRTVGRPKTITPKSGNKHTASPDSPIAKLAGGLSSPTSSKSHSSGIAYKMNGSQTADVAAHFKLLGDNLTIIGERLKEHEGQITVSGSLSVLLDSLLCTLGPLMCLIQHIPGFNDQVKHLKEELYNTLDNIAYVMPGL